MTDFFFLISYLLTLARARSPDIGCYSDATILRQVEREGFHLDVHYLIELVVDVETAPNWENCSLVLRENLSSSFYVNPDQMSELNRTGITRACTAAKVDVEAPQHLSEGHTVYVYGQFQRSQNLIHSHLNFPMCLRYHQPKINGGYSVAQLKSPVLLIHCPNIECKNLLKSKAPCINCKGSLCTWTRFPFKTNNNNITVLVPVGNLNHLWFVSSVTYILSFGGCLYIILAITVRNSN